MRGRLGKVSVLMVTLVVAVGVMGAGFASWTDSLVINGVVTTADFQVGIVDICDMDLDTCPHFDAGPNYREPGGALYPTNPPFDGTLDKEWVGPGYDDWNQLDKNVASTNSTNLGEIRFTKTILDVGQPVVIPFYGGLREEIHNAYPWYASGAAIGIGNAGDIPVHIVDIDFTPLGPDCEILGWLVLDYWLARIYTENAPAVTVGSGAGIASLEEFLSGWPAGEPFQLEPCEMLDLLLYWHFEQEVDVDGDGVPDVMPQGKSCVFEIEIDVEQWAE